MRAATAEREARAEDIMARSGAGQTLLHPLHLLHPPHTAAAFSAPPTPAHACRPP